MEPGGAALVSPVDRILDPDFPFATLELRGQEPPGAPAVEIPEMEPAGTPLPEEDLESVADLPVVEEDPALPEGPAAPEDPGVAGGGPEPPPPGPEPSEPRAPEIVAFHEISYEVKQGDSLWRIAARFLGSGSRFPEIRDLNREVLQDRGSDSVPAGTVLRIRVPGSPEGLKVPGPGVDTSVEGSPAPAPPGREDRVPVYHTVRRSESLQRIARRYFPEEADGWKILFAANKDRLASPDLVREGQVLRIPAR
jgi:nucleoid-associated protein YgaU